MNLHSETKDLHHAVEETALGQAMTSGTPSPGAYAAWISMKLPLYRALDPKLLPASRRTDALTRDLDELRVVAPFSAPAAERFGEALLNGTEKLTTGAAYVLVGGNLMGGEVLRRKLDGLYPVEAFTSPDRASEMVVLRQYRERLDCLRAARMCFQALLDACHEIERAGVI